mmetsp:Transcript_8301/g.18765  ORF Transcript_8301/g.18765 Transcript_8301/m.18765 type:complete len:87 (+) Transcript_8301:1-261(+)
MVATAFHAVLGAFTGAGCAAFANGLRKLPAFSQPWTHAVAAGVGAAAFMYNADMEDSLRGDVEALRAARKAQNADYMSDVRAKRST